MRVLWLSPWMRTLAREYAGELRALGHDVLLVTSNQHPQSLERIEWERVLDPRPKNPATWPAHAAALQEIRRFGADAVVTELVRDPRWMLYAGSVPRIDVVHDDRPHDSGELRPAWERAVFGAWNQRAAATICFSEHVATSLSTSREATVIPLASDVPDSMFGELIPEQERRDFVMLGRLNGYKNIDVVLRAWEQHRHSSAYRGDTLRLYGAAERAPQLPADVWWNGGSYDHADVIPVLARAKGSIAHYRVATQSGVQVLSMQAGVMPIVSTEGALPEFQPPGAPAIDRDDIAGLAKALGELADPSAAAEAGRRARAHYRDTFSAPVAAAELDKVLLGLMSSNRTARVR